MMGTYKVALLGNRKLSVLVGEYLRRDPHVEMMVVLNPDDQGVDEGGAVSLKKRAGDWACTVCQPENLRLPDQDAPIKAFQPDIILSCSYAKIIPKSVIELSNIASLNIHFSDLPRNRGCLPVVWTLAQREPHLTATLHRLSPGIDDGDIIMQERMPLSGAMTSQEATERCAELGFSVFRQYWNALLSGRAPDGVPQEDANATYHKLRHPYDRHPPWPREAEEVAAVVNSLTFAPYPAARARFVGECDLAGEWRILGPATLVDVDAAAGGRAPGDLRRDAEGRLTIACGDGRCICVKGVYPYDESCDPDGLDSALAKNAALVFSYEERPLYSP